MIKPSVEARLKKVEEQRKALVRLSEIQKVLKQCVLNGSEHHKIRAAAHRLHCPPNRVIREAKTRTITRGKVLRVLANAAGKPELIGEVEKLAAIITDRFAGLAVFPADKIELAMDVVSAYYKSDTGNVKLFASAFDPWQTVVAGIVNQNCSAVAKLEQVNITTHVRRLLHGEKWRLQLTDENSTVKQQRHRMFRRFRELVAPLRLRFTDTKVLASRLGVKDSTIYAALRYEDRTGTETLKALIAGCEKLSASGENPAAQLVTRKADYVREFQQILPQLAAMCGSREKTAAILEVNTTTLWNAQGGRSGIATFEKMLIRARQHLGLQDRAATTNGTDNGAPGRILTVPETLVALEEIFPGATDINLGGETIDGVKHCLTPRSFKAIAIDERLVHILVEMIKVAGSSYRRLINIACTIENEAMRALVRKELRADTQEMYTSLEHFCEEFPNRVTELLHAQRETWAALDKAARPTEEKRSTK